jgi:peptidoglycan/xylan/chitin deacetylase (PgdA/CDA1 family)
MSRSRRDRAAALLAKPGVRSVARRLPRWRGVVVLNYHRIGESAGQPWERTLWNGTAERLDEQLATLTRDAEVVGPGDLAELRRAGRPGRRVLLTFDDGYRDNHELAFPLLRRHEVRATFFVATGFLDRARAVWWDEIAWMVRHATRDALPEGLALGPEEDATIGTLVARYKQLQGEQTDRFLEDLAETTGAGRCGADQAAELWMTWDMVRELLDGGMDVGGHTVDHPILARLPVEQQAQEIAGCARRLQEELGRPMTWFAYPVGARDTFTADTKRLLREQGVQLAFSFYGGFASFAHWDPFDVPRLHVGPGHGPELLRAALWLPRLFTRW